MSETRFIFRGSFINMSAMILRIIISPLMLIVPRLFNQEMFGIFISMQSFCTTLATILGLSIHSGLTWWIPKQSTTEGQTARTVWKWLLIVLCLSAGFVLLTALVLPAGKAWIPSGFEQVTPWFYAICLFSVPGSVALSYGSACLMGIRKPQYRATWEQFLSFSLIPILAIGLWPTGLPNALAWSLFGAKWICAAAILAYLAKHFPPRFERSLTALDQSLLRYSLPVAFARLVANVITQIDLWMVLFFLGPASAAVYGIMRMLADGVAKVRLSYDPLIVPVVSRLESNNQREKLRDVLSYTVRMVSMIQIAVAATLACFPKELLSIAGAQYSADLFAFLILLSGRLVNGIGELSSQVVYGLGESALILRRNVITLLFAMPAGLMLIPRYGLLGAAMTSFLMISVQCLQVIVLQTRLTGRWLYKLELAPQMLCLFGFIGAVFLVQSRFALFPLAWRIPIYLVLMIAWGTWAYKERKNIIPSEI
ncbi:MAG: oligosaccharide flippase family protein [Syntrophaceae bacterium]|nr:oligosaccharide flippase family protein [Syntrophaceae bacterium]